MLADSPVVAYAVKQSGGKVEAVGGIYDAAPYGVVVAQGQRPRSPRPSPTRSRRSTPPAAYKKILAKLGQRGRRDHRLRRQPLTAMKDDNRPGRIHAVPVRHPGRWVAIAIILVLAAMFVSMLLTNPAFDWSFIFQAMQQRRCCAGSTSAPCW